MVKFGSDGLDLALARSEGLDLTSAREEEEEDEVGLNLSSTDEEGSEKCEEVEDRASYEL